jgi:hypothetical protein
LREFLTEVILAPAGKVVKEIQRGLKSSPREFAGSQGTLCKRLYVCPGLEQRGFTFAECETGISCLSESGFREVTGI